MIRSSKTDLTERLSRHILESIFYPISFDEAVVSVPFCGIKR